jgi:5-methylcytosine-specific restriction endonuclease McrA
MDRIYKPVLVINATYEPLEITSARNALKKLITKKAVMESEGDGDVYPGIPLPSVIRLIGYRRVPEHMAKLTKKNFYLRDHYRCQYCGRRFDAADLTLDHVFPKSRGGKATWENLVTACMECNQRKNDKTPVEAGMVLLHPPKRLTIHTSKQIMRRIGLDEDPEWGRYLYA